jgi:hypothetical protein
MVLVNLSRRQCDSPSLPRSAFRQLFVLTLALFALVGCRSASDGTWRGTTSDRIIELKAGSAFITEGNSTQAVPYEISGDKIVLKMPFMNAVLRRMPDGSLSGMGETLINVDDVTAALLGTYESSEGEYRLRLSAQGRAVYTRLGRSIVTSYTVNGDNITLNEGRLRIPIKRRPDGSLETPDAVLKKQS